MAEAQVCQSPTKRPILTQIYGEEINKRFELHGPEAKLGRSMHSQIRIDHLSVSRTHCILTLDSEGWHVKDNGSQNGTFVNGVKVSKDSPTSLRFGDIIFLGPPSALPIAFAFDDNWIAGDHSYHKEKYPDSRKECEKNKVKSADFKHPPTHQKVIKAKKSCNSRTDPRHVANSSVQETNSNTIVHLHDLKRTIDSMKADINQNSININKSELISLRQKILKKIKVEHDKDSQTETHLINSQGENSQSLLDVIESSEFLDNPFSEQLGLPDSTSNKNSPLKDVVADKTLKYGSSSGAANSDNKHLLSTLANLQKEVKTLEKSKSELLKEYENMCLKNKKLDEQLTEQKKLKEDLKTCEMRVENNFKTQIMEKLEEDLVCHICTELLIKPVVLDCSHTYCEHCITEWKKKKKQCPICRNPIQCQTRVLALDHFIDQTLETLTPDQKQKRQEVISLREKMKLDAAQAAKRKTKNSRGRRSRSRRGRQPSRINRPIALPGPPSASDIEEQLVRLVNPGGASVLLTDDDQDEIFLSDDDDIDEMFAYGPCINCGEYGHSHFNCQF